MYKFHSIRFLCSLFTLLLLHSAMAQLPAQGPDLWMRADTGLQLDGKKILGWNDLSNNHHNAVTRTSDAPELISASLNGHPVIRFDGSNTGMETPPFATFPGSRGTIIIVAKINGRSLTSGVGMGNMLATYHGQGSVGSSAPTGRISHFMMAWPGMDFPSNPMHRINGRSFLLSG